MLPRNFEDKYHSRPHPLLMKCEARAISRDPVLMRAIEPLGRDLMRERTRSRIQYGGR